MATAQNETATVDTRVGPLPVRTIGSGPPVLAVHGALVDGRLWDSTAQHLAGHAAVVIPDLPLGAHRTAVPDRTRLTPRGLAGALIDVLDHLGHARALVVGNDTGGALAQIAASASPERVDGLVLAGCDAFEHFPPPLARPITAAAAVPGGVALTLRLLAWPPVLADAGALNLFTTRGFGRAWVEDLLRPARTDRAIHDDLRALLRSVSPEPLLAAVDGLRAHAGRAAVVWGRNDRIFPHRDAERLARLLHTRVRWVDRAGTFLPLDRPDAVAAAVVDLLAATVGRPRPTTGQPLPQLPS